MSVLKKAVIAQLGERQTEDLKVPDSIPGRGMVFFSDLKFQLECNILNKNNLNKEDICRTRGSHLIK